MNYVMRFFRIGIITGIKLSLVFVVAVSLFGLIFTIANPPGWSPSLKVLSIMGGIGFAVGFVFGVFRFTMCYFICVSSYSGNVWLRKGAMKGLELVDELGTGHNPAEIISSFLHDEDSGIRRGACRALGIEALHTERKHLFTAIENLIAVLDDSQVKKDALDSLAGITGVFFGEDKARWKTWFDQNKDKSDSIN
jgi:hypothetical protein